jgi:hypothetical protein
MSHPIFRTSQAAAALHFDVAGHCFIAERHAGANHRAALVPDDGPRSGTLLSFLFLLLGITVSADVGHVS